MPLPVMRASLKMFPGVLQQVYGMTEQSGVVSVLGAADHADPAVAHRLVSAGKAIARRRDRDPRPGDRRAACATGERGEVWVRSEQVMGGYWGKPDATAATITPDGWLRSGDGGYLDADGYLYITDRIKDMIISGGENIYPAEIERVLAEHPSIQDVAVIGVPDERWGEVPKAVVVAAARRDHRHRAAARLVPRAAGVVQVPEDRRRRRRAAAQSDRQDPEEGSAQAVLGRARAADRLGRAAAVARRLSRAFARCSRRQARPRPSRRRSCELRGASAAR